MSIPGLEAMLAKRRAVVDSVSITPVGPKGGRPGVTYGEDPTARLRAELRQKLGCKNFGQRSQTGFVGLVNQGATCYLNSLLQTMFMTPELRRALYAWEYNPEIHGEAKRCVPYQLQRLFARLQLTSASAVSTRDLTKSFGFDSNDAFRQQDVMECMAVLYEFLATIGAGTPLGDHVTGEQTGVMENYLSFSDDGTEFEHNRDESFRAVTIAVKSMPSIIDALGAHISPDEISGYFAEELQRKVTAFKGERFKTLPKILTLHLGRYDFDLQTFRRVKLDDPVKMAEVLDMAPFTVKGGDGQVTKYELYSAMIHVGNANGGHYFAYIKDVLTGKWLTFNDERVDVLDHERVIDALGQSRDEAAGDGAKDGSAKDSSAKDGSAKDGASEDDAAAKEKLAAGAGGAGAGAGAANADKAKKDTQRKSERRLTSAAKYAYMLVYRQMDGTKPEPITEDQVPKNLREEIGEEKKEYDELYARYQREQEMCRLRIFRDGSNSLAVLHQSKPVRELLEMAHASLAAEGDAAVPLERCRLRKFSYLHGVSMQPLEDLDVSLKDAGITTRSNLRLETREEGEEFPLWVEGGIDVLLALLPDGGDAFDTPVQVNLASDTVGDLRVAAKVKFRIDANVKLVYMKDETLELDDDALTLDAVGIKTGSKVYVESWDGEAPSRIVAKFDKAMNEVDVKFNSLDAELPPSPANPDAAMHISFDGRHSLEQLKAAIAERIGTPVTEFKFMKDYHRGPELKDLSKSLEWAGLSGEYATVYIRRGTPMLPNQVSVKVSLYNPVYLDQWHRRPGEESKQDEGKTEDGAAGGSADAAAPEPEAARPPEPPTNADGTINVKAAAAAAAAHSRRRAAAAAAKKAAEKDTAKKLISLGSVIVDVNASCDEVREAIHTAFGDQDGVPPKELMRLRQATGKRPGTVMVEDKVLKKNAHPLRDGRRIVVQPTLVPERFTSSHILLETRCWHPDTTLLERTREVAFDRNTTVEKMKEVLSELCGGAVAPENMVLARAQLFHMRKLTNMPKLLWTNQPAKFDTVGECNLKLRNGSIIVYKDKTIDEVLVKKKKPTAAGGAAARRHGPARREVGFRILTPAEQLERERKKKEAKEKREKELAERMKLAEAQRDKAHALADSVTVDSEELLRYTRMIRVGVPLPRVKHAMSLAGLPFSLLGLNEDGEPLDGSEPYTPAAAKPNDADTPEDTSAEPDASDAS